jgi:hypothetical protein
MDVVRRSVVWRCSRGKESHRQEGRGEESHAKW